jgi:hypothetical protein
VSMRTLTADELARSMNKGLLTFYFKNTSERIGTSRCMNADVTHRSATRSMMC